MPPISPIFNHFWKFWQKAEVHSLCMSLPCRWRAFKAPGKANYVPGANNVATRALHSTHSAESANPAPFDFKHHGSQTSGHGLTRRVHFCNFWTSPPRLGFAWHILKLIERWPTQAPKIPFFFPVALKRRYSWNPRRTCNLLRLWPYPKATNTLKQLFQQLPAPYPYNFQPNSSKFPKPWSTGELHHQYQS